MDYSVMLTSVLIFSARVADVSLGTVRTINMVQGRRGIAWVLGFVELIIWVSAISKVVENLDEPLYALSYALGFATGTVVGLSLESWIALGNQVVQVFTRKGAEIARQLRSEGFRLTSFVGEGRDGPIDMLFIEIPRRKTRDITCFVRELDPKSFYTVEDAKDRPLPDPSLLPMAWRDIRKKK